ncbi:MAG TPA: glycogen/starch synthase, partial [Rhodocyclaceae bacterium]|nr:glycogen/starch synthase [Rhodocyclaceae bacterium]
MARRKAAGTPSLRVLFATSEIAPWVKTGGLGDVASALPAALAAQGHGVRVLVPGYPALLAAFPDRMRIASIGHIAGAMLPADLSSVRLD